MTPRYSQNVPDTAEPRFLARAGRFGRQLSSGFGFRFESDIETDYRASLLAEARQTAPLAIGIGLFIWSAFVLFDIWRLVGAAQDMPGEDKAGILGMRLAVLIAFAAGLSRPVRERINPGLLLTLLFSLMSIGTIYAVALYREQSVVNANVALIVLVMVVFLPIGMSLLQALFVSAVTAVAMMSARALHDAGPIAQEDRMLVVVLLLAVAVSAIAYVARDQLLRRRFLLEKTLAHVATHDALTGLANRRLFVQRAETAMAQARREGQQVALALIDVDFFKRFNDIYGHSAGDDILVRVSAQIEGISRRPLDIAARVGGEEFALLLFDTERDTATRMLEQLLGDIRGLAIPHSGSEVAGYLTVSIGLAMQDKDDTLQSLYRNADSALYAAKNAGRNRIADFPLFL